MLEDANVNLSEEHIFHDKSTHTRSEISISGDENTYDHGNDPYPEGTMVTRQVDIVEDIPSAMR